MIHKRKKGQGNASASTLANGLVLRYLNGLARDLEAMREDYPQEVPRNLVWRILLPFALVCFSAATLVVIGLVVISRMYAGHFSVTQVQATFTGAAIGTISIWAAWRTVGIVAHRRDAKDREARIAAASFLEFMYSLESECRLFVSRRLSKPSADISLLTVLRGLEVEGVWTSSQVKEFRELLKLRNLLVHDQKLPTMDALDAAITQAQALLDELPNSSDWPAKARVIP
jgi:hypothetical protein